MEIEGEIEINKKPKQVWEVISDPDILFSAIPGAQEIERISEEKFEGTIKQTVAGYEVQLDGSVERTELDPYTHMSAVANGKDNRAGKWTNLEGTAEMELEGDGNPTILHYTVDVKVSGRLASIGARILKPKIQSDIETCFENIKDIVEE